MSWIQAWRGSAAGEAGEWLLYTYLGCPKLSQAKALIVDRIERAGSGYACACSSIGTVFQAQAKSKID